jgi:uncharacterized protein (TIGR00297 family)
MAATGYLFLLRLLLSAKLLPRWCWCWLCSRFDCKSRKGTRLRMDEEMQGGEGDTGWRKAIPEARDRLQSKWLVGVVGTLLVLMSADVVRWTRTFGVRFPVFVLEVFVLSVAFALIVRRLRAATLGGAVCGGLICLHVTFWTGVSTMSVVQSGLTPLVLLFLLTFLATRAGRKRKVVAGLAEGRRGRNAGQVIANLSVAGMCASPWTAWVLAGRMGWMLTGAAVWMMKGMCLAALVEATADTVSSEIGQAFGGVPVMLVGLRRVDVGTDGAVTLLGSGAGVVAGVLVAAVGAWALRLSVTGGTIAGIAGICGLFFDSLLGATVERRGWLGNDLVNFASTLFAAVLAAVVYRLLLH